MTSHQFKLAFVTLALAALLVSPARRAQTSGRAGEVQASTEAGGEHLRLVTEKGVIHLWRPSGYDVRTAGVVIYVHGYFTSADQTWTLDNLAAQFQASGRNALFIAPEASQSPGAAVRWKSPEALLRTVQQTATLRLPQRPLVVIGHSGAFRTVMRWLRDPRVQSVILLDGLYRGTREFRHWLMKAPGHESHKIVLVANETTRQAEGFARRFRGAVKRESIPEDFSEFTPRERRARLFYLRSQYEHNEIVNAGKVIPLLLRLTPLTSLQTPESVRTKRAGTRPRE